MQHISLWILSGLIAISFWAPGVEAHDMRSMPWGHGYGWQERQHFRWGHQHPWGHESWQHGERQQPSRWQSGHTPQQGNMPMQPQRWDSQPEPHRLWQDRRSGGNNVGSNASAGRPHGRQMGYEADQRHW